MANVLNSLSDELAGLVEASAPSIVRVEARRRLAATGIVWSEDGLIVTAHHVVERRASEIGVGLPDGKTVSAELVGRDPSTDVAVLRAAASGLVPAEWGNVEELKVGNLVLALGRPGEDVLATLGVISAADGNWRTRSGGRLEHFLQTDVLMYPGFSGGPLVGADHQVLGMNTSGLARGISLAITLPTIERVVDTLIKHGRIRRGYLGVGVQSVKLPGAVAEQTGQESGALIVSVEPGSPAEDSGLMLGDTLVSIDGEPVQNVEGLLGLLASLQVGAEVSIQAVRAGQVIEIKATLGERNDES
jgi:S1-C subfamily serine protease